MASRESVLHAGCIHPRPSIARASCLHRGYVGQRRAIIQRDGWVGNRQRGNLDRQGSAHLESGYSLHIGPIPRYVHCGHAFQSSDGHSSRGWRFRPYDTFLEYVWIYSRWLGMVGSGQIGVDSKHAVPHYGHPHFRSIHPCTKSDSGWHIGLGRTALWRMDSHNHVQQVQQAGTSGPGPVSPNFTQGGRTDDNTVTWVDIGQAVWRPSFAYGLNAIIKDSAGHVQQATTPGTSGPNQPTFVDGNSPGGTAIDGLQWQQSGTKCKKSCPSAWVAGTQYSAGTSITDGLGYVWNAKTAGTSGTAVNRPPFESKEIQNLTLADNAVVWADQGLLSISNMISWQPSNAYVVNAEIIDTAQHVELVTVAGISGPRPSAPSFVD